MRTVSNGPSLVSHTIKHFISIIIIIRLLKMQIFIFDLCSLMDFRHGKSFCKGFGDFWVYCSFCILLGNSLVRKFNVPYVHQSVSENEWCFGEVTLKLQIFSLAQKMDIKRSKRLVGPLITWACFTLLKVAFRSDFLKSLLSWVLLDFLWHIEWYVSFTVVWCLLTDGFWKI